MGYTEITVNYRTSAGFYEPCGDSIQTNCGPGLSCVMFDAGAPTGLCLAPCNANSTCPTTFGQATCSMQLTDSSFVCVLDCTTAACPAAANCQVLQQLGGSANDCGGWSTPPQPLNFLDPCDPTTPSPNPCGSGDCVSIFPGDPNGMCLPECTDGDASMCPSGMGPVKCADINPNGNQDNCYVDCSSDQSVCQLFMSCMESQTGQAICSPG
jgi:hypothetical protein